MVCVRQKIIRDLMKRLNCAAEPNVTTYYRGSRCLVIFRYQPSLNSARNTPLPQLLDCDGHGRELEEKMLTKALVIAVCGIGATVPTLADDEARIFQYSSIARLVGEGQYRAEVWKREIASGKEEPAWSSSDLHRSSEQAIVAACTTLRENFASSCTQTSRNAKAGETVRGPGSVVVVTEKSSLRSKALPANPPIPPVKEVAAASNPGSSNWAKKFWVYSSQQRM
jgi:hypothetical protein